MFNNKWKKTRITCCEINILYTSYHNVILMFANADAGFPAQHACRRIKQLTLITLISLFFNMLKVLALVNFNYFSIIPIKKIK